MKDAQWGRWRWRDTGFGRWHAIVEAGEAIDENGNRRGFVVRLACARLRRMPALVHDGQPPRDECCGECLSLDDLRKRFATSDPMEAPKEVALT